MPVGIPKVPYLLPGDEDASWVELYNRLFEERILFLGQEINSETSNQLVGLIIYLSLEDPNKDLYMFINSPGGGVISGMAVFDAMQFVAADVQTLCVGLAASMGSLILLGGTVTKRLAFPNARIMMHQPASSFYDGPQNECYMEADEMVTLRENIENIYIIRTGKPRWQIANDLERDVFMSAEEAKYYGIIDIIADENYYY